MPGLTKERDTIEIANGAGSLAFPMAENVTIYQGALVALNENGFAVPASKAENLRAAGRAEETITNIGADGDVFILVARGVFIFNNSATQANRVSTVHLLKPCYFEDDQTVSALATGSSMAGLVLRVDARGVAVQIDPTLSL